MNQIQSLYYALGELAYAVASADGILHVEEKKAFNKLISAEMSKDSDFDYAEIIFSILQKDNMPVDVCYQWALEEMKQNKEALTPELRKKFSTILTAVSEAYPPTEPREKELIRKFCIEIDNF